MSILILHEQIIFYCRCTGISKFDGRQWLWDGWHYVCINNTLPLYQGFCFLSEHYTVPATVKRTMSRSRKYQNPFTTPLEIPVKLNALLWIVFPVFENHTPSAFCLYSFLGKWSGMIGQMILHFFWVLGFSLMENVTKLFAISSAVSTTQQSNSKV